MPRNTDIYGFTYPCPGEAVGAPAIALLAGQIDTKMADVDNDYFEMLNRYNANVAGVTQNIPNGVDTVLTAPTYTFPVAGVWIVTAQVFSLSSPATINSFRGRLRINATPRFGVTVNTQNFVTSSPRPTVPMVAAAGDVASVTVLYNGTGTMDVQARLMIKMVCRIA